MNNIKQCQRKMLKIMTIYPDIPAEFPAPNLKESIKTDAIEEPQNDMT